MKGISITDEKLAIREESQFFYSAGSKGAGIPDSSVRRCSNNNGILKGFSDEELVRSFVEDHDEGTFNEIVNRYGDKIYRTALRITHNTSDAEDVLQEVFITLIEKINTFHRGSKFSTWLYRVTANASFIHLRDEKKYKNEVSLEEYVSHDEDGAFKGVETKDWSDRPDEVLQSKEAMEIIEKAVNELPVHHRVVFHLRDVEGFTSQEVAKVLGLSLTAVKTRIHRARLLLRNKLLDYFYAGFAQLVEKA
jgi:RNA polymerase sigma-70 factor, ECF subfamily